MGRAIEISFTSEAHHWWESSTEKRARFASISTLHSLLGAATVNQIAQFSLEDRAFLQRELARWLGKKTGWYLDIELPIRLFLTIASAHAPGSEPLAQETYTQHADPRLVEAAREYLVALGAT